MESNPANKVMQPQNKNDRKYNLKLSFTPLPCDPWLPCGLRSSFNLSVTRLGIKRMCHFKDICLGSRGIASNSNMTHHEASALNFGEATVNLKYTSWGSVLRRQKLQNAKSWRWRKCYNANRKDLKWCSIWQHTAHTERGDEDFAIKDLYNITHGAAAIQVPLMMTP